MDNTTQAGNCIVKKKFLFWKWQAVEHDYKIFLIRKFMYSSTSFIVTWHCSKCGTPKVQHFVTHDELILMGISPEILNTIDTAGHYFRTEK